MELCFFSATYKNRRWILDFIKKKFTKDSYFVITDAAKDVNPKRYKDILNNESLGIFDYTAKYKSDAYIPIPKYCTTVDDYIFFDKNYFSVLCRSKFTLCPAGDAPWSMRFFEAILCKSIPILESDIHSGRNNKERSINYKYYFINDNHVYREDWVIENYKKFIDNQTLLNA